MFIAKCLGERQGKMTEVLKANSITGTIKNEQDKGIFKDLKDWEGIDLSCLRERLRNGKIIDLMPVDDESIMLIAEDKAKKLFAVDLFTVQLADISKTLKGKKLPSNKLAQVLEAYAKTNKMPTLHAQILELKQ